MYHSKSQYIGRVPGLAAYTRLKLNWRDRSKLSLLHGGRNHKLLQYKIIKNYCTFIAWMQERRLRNKKNVIYKKKINHVSKRLHQAYCVIGGGHIRCSHIMGRHHISSAMSVGTCQVSGLHLLPDRTTQTRLMSITRHKLQEWTSKKKCLFCLCTCVSINKVM